MIEKLLNALKQKGLLNDEQLSQITPEALNDSASLQKELLGKGWVKEKDLAQAKGEILGIPYADLTGRKIDENVLREVPENTVRRYRFAPIERQENEMALGMVDPEDVEAREALKFVSVQGHFTPKIYIITPSDLEDIANQYRNLGTEVNRALQELEAELLEEQEKEPIEGREALEEISAEAPITKVVAVMLRHAVEGHASDIHIEPLETKIRVRFRVDGDLQSSLYLPIQVHPAIVARIKILSNLKIDESRVPQDGRFQTSIGSKKIDFRVSSLPTSTGEKVVLRILDPTAGVGTFDDLGLIGPNRERYERAIKKPFGLVLITGPTGSGKSTTLYTTLTKINKEEVNIITLEDPVEYYLEGVNQSQIRPEIDYTFASGLRSILRQDPDIIMVGEVRDKETATLVSHAALTGHLVFSTLHTNDSLGIIPRLINMGIEPYLIPPTLALGVAQRLVRRLCNECIKEMQPTPAQAELIQKIASNIPAEVINTYGVKEPYKIFKSEGCQACGNTGSKGRVAIYEMFEMTPELEKVVLSNISENDLAQEADRQGMITLREDGIMKALKGIISIEEVLRAVEE